MSINRRTRPLCLLLTATSAFAAPASAASFVASNANLDSIFAAARGGDTIVLKGIFDQTVLANRRFTTALRIDASGASFNGTLIIRNMQGVVVSGGKFGGGGAWQNGGTIRVEQSDGIRFLSPQLTADGSGLARGLTIRESSNFTVSNGSFSGFRIALGSSSSRNGVFINNRITGATSDGMNIVDSHFISARGNSCSGGVPSTGAHPDCIQLWSLAGNPVQSDIKLLYNSASGYTQGFTSFDPDRGGGLRIQMIGNRVNTSLPQGIACYGCVDSIITNNVLTTLPGANHRTWLRVIGGSNNIVANNSIGLHPAAALQGRARAAAAMAGEIALAGVPEPGVWMQCLAGFALLGGALRHRRTVATLALSGSR
jgi:hypothetical protein